MLQCVNPSGDNPPPQKVNYGFLSHLDGLVSKGKLADSITIGPPPLPSASQICQNPNWTVTILSLIYDNVVLRIIQNNQVLLTFDFGDIDP